ncbi:MAG: hypothetical protein LUQ37_01635 [Methanoregulaceae archaeon]|nr:hypothetical protein [Methanoregulaceae archaeon]
MPSGKTPEYIRQMNMSERTDAAGVFRAVWNACGKGTPLNQRGDTPALRP